MGAPKYKENPEKRNKMAATHDWVLVMDEKGKKTFEWVPKKK